MINGPTMLYYYGFNNDSLHNLYYNTDYITVVSIFTADLCVGLPALLWALWMIYKHRKTRGHISAFIILLLINDLLELLLTVIVVSDGFLNYMYTYHTLDVCAFLVIFKIDGMYLHQLVALESILTYKHKNLSDFFCSTPCSIILCVVLCLIVAGCQAVRTYGWLLNLVLYILPFCILAITCTLTCKAPPPNCDPAPPTGLKPGSAVLIVATLTLSVFTVQAVAVLIISLQIEPEFYQLWPSFNTLSAFLVNLRVISDPLLCVLVCKEKLRAQTQQTHSELNTEHQSV